MNALFAASRTAYSLAVSLSLCGVVLGSGACSRDEAGDEMTGEGLQGTDNAALHRLEKGCIVFAHQSVGADILEGVAELGRATAGLRVTVKDAGQLRDDSGPGIYETRVGRNGDPHGKIDDFARLLDAGAGRKADIAMMKLCYVDVDEHTDVEALFAHYRATLAGLRERYPRVTFVHITMPLQGPPDGAVSKARQLAKALLGRGRVTAAMNANRERFNELMRREYGAEALFDLARIESTRPDGSAAFLALDGERVPRLAAEYTDDGGHLNSRGRRVAARAFLELLARLLAEGRATAPVEQAGT